ncbi:hypothetical protein VTL71DRAFT_9127 [Oculimacula yallundae]|uniref:Uncharacterized protein n=1 Tax=Oculimacula yallundae TaxID=86028 RepID=A0ABR4BTV5_9HELO
MGIITQTSDQSHDIPILRAKPIIIRHPSSKSSTSSHIPFLPRKGTKANWYSSLLHAGVCLGLCITQKSVDAAGFSSLRETRKKQNCGKETERKETQ